MMPIGTPSRKCKYSPINNISPHKLIPHSVWIGEDGEVKAITSGRQVTEKNISTYLTHHKVDAPFKKDQPTGSFSCPQTCLTRTRFCIMTY